MGLEAGGSVVICILSKHYDTNLNVRASTTKREWHQVAHELKAQIAKKHKKKHYAPPYVAPAAPAPLPLGDAEAHAAALNVAFNTYLDDYDATYSTGSRSVTAT